MLKTVTRHLIVVVALIMAMAVPVYADDIHTEWSFDGVTWNDGSVVTGINQRRIVYWRTHNATKGLYSAITSVEVLVDMDAPSTDTITFTPDRQPHKTGWYSDNVTYNVAGAQDPVGKGVVPIPGRQMSSGIKGYKYSVSKGGVYSVNKKDMTGVMFSLPVGTVTGENLMEVWSVDNAGNVATTPKSFRVKIDKDTPTAPQIVLSNTNWTNLTVTFKATGGAVGDTSGLQGYKYSFDNKTWYALAASTPIPVNGVTQIYVKAIDNAMRESVSTIATAKVDKKQAEYVTFSTKDGALSPEWYNKPVEVSLTEGMDEAYGTDNRGNEDRNKVVAGSGIKSIYYRIDKGAWTLYTVPFICDESALIEAIGVDEAGNGQSVVAP